MPAAGRTILLVEDDPDLRSAVGHVLRRAGYRVVEAGDAAQAFAALHGPAPDLIFLDVVLPGGSGFRVLDAARTAGRPAVPVVMMSGLGSDAHRHYAQALGADGFLPKPFPLADLLAAARRLCPPAPAAAPVSLSP